MLEPTHLQCNLRSEYLVSLVLSKWNTLSKINSNQIDTDAAAAGAAAATAAASAACINYEDVGGRFAPP